MSRLHDVICISSIDWDFIWQGHQEIMSTLAARGHRVLYIENTGIRAPTWRDLPRLRQRFRNWRRSTRGFRREQENLFIYSPCILPFPYSRAARWINRWWLMRDLRQWMAVMGFDRPVIWTFLPTRLAGDIIRALNPKAAVYYCIDNLSMSSRAARRIQRAEQEMFQLADLVFVTSKALEQSASAAAREVHLFPFGVNFERFDAWRSVGGRAEQEETTGIPRPRIGYVGGIHQWLDQRLLCDVADRHPEWSLVLVGPEQTDVSLLKSRRNIHLLGSKPHEALPSYIHSFDVAMIPYRLTSYTQCVYPTKTNEYFAMGKPVVSTSLQEIIGLNERYGSPVRIGQTPEQFIACIADALRDGSPQEAAHRIEVARRNSWSQRITEMTQLIERRIVERERERVLNWQRVFAMFLDRARMRLVRIGLPVLSAYLLLCHTPLAWWLAGPLKMSEPPRRADAIVVFGGGVGESGEAGQGYEERLEHAVRLYQAGLAPRLIISSGYSRVFREADVMLALATSLGVPRDAISLDEIASNTYENVRFVAATLPHTERSSILLVSSPYHMRRVSAVLKRQAPGLEMIPSPPARNAFYAHGWGATPHQLRGILHEYAALFVYWVKQWV